MPAINRSKAAAIGAVFAVVAVFLQSLVDPTKPGNSNLLEWLGTALGGAIIGVVVAKAMELRRPR